MMDCIEILPLDARLPAMLPTYETPGAAAMDIRAMIDEPVEVSAGRSVMIPAGFAMALPPGYVALLLPRSGLGHKHGLVLGNLVGVIDSDYRGPVNVSVWCRSDPMTIHPLDRIAQMMVMPVARAQWRVVGSLGETQRGAGGFGSTGRS